MAAFAVALLANDVIFNSEALSERAEYEIRKQLNQGADAVVLRDANKDVYAVLLTPAEFSSLRAVATIAARDERDENTASIEERFADRSGKTLHLAEALKLLEPS